MRSIGALAVLLVVADARAATPPRPTDLDLAKAHLRRASAFFDGGRYEEAITEFEESYRLLPVAVVLYNLALCHERLGSVDEARAYYARYLVADPKGAGAATARAALERLASPASGPAPTDRVLPPATAASGPLSPAGEAPPPPPAATLPATITALAAPAETSTSGASRGVRRTWIIGLGAGAGALAVGAVALAVATAVASGSRERFLRDYPGTILDLR